MKDLLNVHVDSKGDHIVEIASLTGQATYSDMTENLEYIIVLSDYEKGIYIVSIRSKGFVTTIKNMKL